MSKNSRHASRNSSLCPLTNDCIVRNALDRNPGAKPKIARQLDWSEPELSRQVVAIDMNVSRFVGFMAIEVETIRARPEDSRHARILPKHYDEESSIPWARRRTHPLLAHHPSIILTKSQA